MTTLAWAVMFFTSIYAMHFEGVEGKTYINLRFLQIVLFFGFTVSAIFGSLLTGLGK